MTEQGDQPIVPENERPMKYYKPEIGERIENTAFNMLQLANESGEPVKSQFNDYEFIAYPGDTLDQVEQRWKDERDRKSQEIKS